MMIGQPSTCINCFGMSCPIRLPEPPAIKSAIFKLLFIYILLNLIEPFNHGVYLVISIDIPVHTKRDIVVVIVA